MHKITRRILYSCLRLNIYWALLWSDKDGIIKSVSRSNGSLPSCLIGTKWYDAFSIPAEEIDIVEERNPEIFRLRELLESNYAVFPSYVTESIFDPFYRDEYNDECTEEWSRSLIKPMALSNYYGGTVTVKSSKWQGYYNIQQSQDQ